MGLEKELEQLLNRYSRENPSNTPDFILAQYVMGCLVAFENAVQRREEWYGRASAEPVVLPAPCTEGGKTRCCCIPF